MYWQLTMKSIVQTICVIALSLPALPCPGQATPQEQALKLHNIFGSDMVLQRGKPIKIWGWGRPGDPVSVDFGGDTRTAVVAAAAPVNVFGEAETYAGKGRWEVTLPEWEANAEPQTLTVTAGDESVVLENILVGDVWVMYGQSNMAFPSRNTDVRDLLPQANMPLLRFFSIQGNEQASLQDDIRRETIDTVSGGWDISTPETAREFTAIGYAFGLNLQRSLDIPIGVIKNARGGASIESMVPADKFDEHPLTGRYADFIRQRMAEFDPEATADEIWERQKARAQNRNEPEPERPDPANLRSWDVPGKSPSDMASLYNGMFGVFKGYHIKGVLFHQGYNNAINENCRPLRYRILTRLMIEGIREEFEDPDLAFGIIGFCAGGTTQNEDNFELQTNDGAPYIREAQRLGLADVENQTNLFFLPAYDVKVPGLHPGKKRQHGERAAHWTLSRIYPDTGVGWQDDVELLSAEPNGDHFILTFSASVICDSRDSIPRGFSIAGEDGRFYMAHARYAGDDGHPSRKPDVIRVWSPLVGNPVAVRYGWARSPLGNLKHRGDEQRPFPSFRTDSWDFPESEDPAVSMVGRAEANQRRNDAAERLELRQIGEARAAIQIVERLKELQAPSAASEE